MQFTDEQIRVCRNLLDIGRRYKVIDGVPVLMHLLITHQESAWIEDNPGDAGLSNGPYQIYAAAHPRINREIAIDPGFDYGFWEIHERWRDVFAGTGIDWLSATRMERTAWLLQHASEMQGSIAWNSDNALSAYNDSMAMLEILT